MSRTPRERVGPKRSGDDRTYLSPKYQHLAALAVLFAALTVFFAPVIFGSKTFLSADTIASHSWDTLLADAEAQGIFPLWNPYIFCGMPGYGSLTFGGERLFDISAVVLSKLTILYKYLMLNSPVGWILFYYFVFGVGMYALAFSKTASKLGALVAALGATFSTYIVIWIMIGHNTKISVIAFFPLILLIVEKLRSKFDLRLALALVLLLHFAFLPSHVQMIYYMYLALGIYLLYSLVRTAVKREDWKGVVRAGVVLAASTVLAFAMDADKYLSVWEYNPYSMRGSAPIVSTPETGEKTQAGGLDYDYATNWSFAPGEIMTFLVPSWYGFGPLEYRGPLTAQPVKLNMYWGPQPFVDGAQYMGVVVLILAAIGFLRHRKDPFVQASGLVIVVALLISFGKEFSPVYDLMFKYFPMFNKFRVPAMILVLVQIFVPLLAAYGIASLFSDAARGISKASEKKWKAILVGLTALLVLTLAAGSAVQSVYSSFFPLKDVGPHIARMVRSNQMPVISELYNFVGATVTTDITMAALFLLLAFGGFYIYAKGLIKLPVMAAMLLVAVVWDLWRIDTRPMDPKDRMEQKQMFSTPEYVKFLQRDTTLYRTLTLINGQPPYDNTLAYWRVQSAYGYQGAKLREYQDMVDVAGLGNPLVWQLMNVKYIISNQPDSSQMVDLVYNGPDMKVYFNRAAAPRAFFVNRYEVAGGMEMLNKMAALSFNPADVAYVLDDPHVRLDPPQDNASAVYTHYGLQSLTLHVTATGSNLLFLSEAYYPKGWTAFLDGKETPIYRLNYMFRGVVVPVGTHTLDMKFEPQSFYLGKNLSLAANILVLGSLLVLGLDWWRKRTRMAPPSSLPPAA